ncbi:MAG TPA: hypothetical protein VHE53_00895 [Patescibacteria group bacterium]|nr:hypothetical protein [Patescibacteria group bacterium]
MQQLERFRKLRPFAFRKATETPSQEPPKYPSIIDPINEWEKQRLEVDCERILAKEKITPQDFDIYVDSMVQILGCTENSPRQATSNMIQGFSDGHSIGIWFEQGEDRKYSIRTRNECMDETKPLHTKGEEVRLNMGSPSFSPEYFTEATYYLDNNRVVPQYFKALTEDKPVEIDYPWEQTTTLTDAQTLGFMRKTFDIYKTWQDAGVFEAEVSGGKYKIDYHKIESDRVWTFIPNESSGQDQSTSQGL